MLIYSTHTDKERYPKNSGRLFYNKKILEGSKRGISKPVVWGGPREFRDPRDSREPPDCGKERRFRPFSRDSREFREILEIPPVKRTLS